MRCAFAVFVGVKRFENGNSTSRAATVVAGIVEFFVEKQAATDCWRVTELGVSARCSDMVVHSASGEDNQASSALMALVNLRTVQILSILANMLKGERTIKESVIKVSKLNQWP